MKAVSHKLGTCMHPTHVGFGPHVQIPECRVQEGRPLTSTEARLIELRLAYNQLKKRKSDDARVLDLTKRLKRATSRIGGLVIGLRKVEAKFIREMDHHSITRRRLAAAMKRVQKLEKQLTKLQTEDTKRMIEAPETE